ncbi:pentatricopeptide repeat-containing protein At2g06000 [Glycine max]|uniref:pentatricopeptide repeat-containing protein At2g06000 n=1 Tax=Glycine max TaxID=3847 RepID=UPI000E21BE49|nr:pentatricopeptide repeat-containing protein At2g06000 [Glycine max]|eukprot:XP_025984510.1 pentatricopeptide repeat-containing protein At2g06000-like [Glycine max]
MPFNSSTGPPTTTTTPTHPSTMLPSPTSCSPTPSLSLQLTLRQPRQHVHQCSRPPWRCQRRHSLVPQSQYLHKGRCVYSCNSILGVLVRANYVNIAKAIYDQVLTEAILELDVYTYTTMICGLCKVGMVESARKVFEEIPCKPNMVTYNTLIHGFCKKGDMEGATRLFDKLVENKSCKPDVECFTTLIEGYSKRSDFRDALECLKEMMEGVP